MEIVGWLIWLLICGYGIFSLSAFLYEILQPVPYQDGLQVLYPLFLRRLIAGFEALGFIGAAIIILLMQVSKFHLLWFAPVWWFFGIPRWFEWIYLYTKPELIDVIYPESNITLWFSLLCPFSPQLVPDLIRKIHKMKKKHLLKYQAAMDCIANVVLSPEQISEWDQRCIEGGRMLADMGVPSRPYNVMSEIKRTELIINAIESIEDVTTLENIFQMSEEACRCVGLSWFLESGWHVYSSYRKMSKSIRKRVKERLSVVKR